MGQMTCQLFPRVHTSLSALLSLQKAGGPIESGLVVLNQLIREGADEADASEWAAVCSAVAIGLRVLADASLRKAEFSSLSQRFASIVDFVFSYRNAQLSLKWAEHCRPLMAILLSDVFGNNHHVTLLLSAVHSIVSHVLRSDVLVAGLFSADSVPVFGKLVFVCLDIVIEESRSTESRRLAARILQILSYDAAVSHLSVVLPGLTSRLSAHLCSSACDNVNVTITLVKVIFSAISVCLKDNTSVEKEEVTSSASTSRSSEWATSTSLKLTPLIINLCARLGSHRDEGVRLAVLRGVFRVHSECSQSFNHSIRPTLSDLIFLLLVDNQKCVSHEARQCLHKLKTKYPNETVMFVNDRLAEMSERLPSAVRLKVDPDASFRQLMAMVAALDSECVAMATTRSPVLVGCLRSLATSLRVEVVSLNACLTETSSVKDLIQMIPLKFEIPMRRISDLCRHFATIAGVEIIDVLNEELRDCDQTDRVSFLLIAALICEQLPSLEDPIPVLLLAESCANDLAALPLGVVPTDVEVKNLSEETTATTSLAIALLCSLTSCSKHLDSSRNKILLKSVYSLLLLCESSTWILSVAADIALRDLSRSSGFSVSSFLMLHSSYVLSSVSLATRSPEAQLYSPRAFEAFLNRVNDREAFGVVAHIVDDLVAALDIHLQEWTWVVLHALRSFVAAMNRWFPEIRPEEIDDTSEELVDEEKNIVPKEVACVEKILFRTKHLLSSEHLPVRIIVMNTLRMGLHFLRFFENTLLPLVHQNWQALVHRLDDDNLESRRVAFSVMVEMSKVSNTFVYRRIRFEAWPRLSSFMANNVIGKAALPHSASFKLCNAILSEMVDVFVSVGLSTEDWAIVRPSLLPFLSNHVHPLLKAVVEQSLARGDEAFHH